MMKKLVSLILAVLIALSLCACDGSPTESAAPSPAASGDVYNVVTYRNHGKRISVYEKPKAVLTIGPNCTEVFCALGLEELVVSKCMTNHSKGVLSDLAEAYDTIPTLSVGYPSFDAIVESGCDFVYASEWLFDDDLTVGMLENKGITVYVSSAKTYSELWRELRDLGSIFQRSIKAETLIFAEKDRIEDVEQVLSGCEKTPVLVLDSFFEDHIYTAGGNNIETQYLDSAGCRNIFKSLDKEWDAVSVEEAAALDPFFIVIHDYSGSSYESKVAALKADPVLSQLDCVKYERFVKLSLENIMPGMRSGVTVETIAYSVHYDIFNPPSDTELPQESTDA